MSELEGKMTKEEMAMLAGIDLNEIDISEIEGGDR